MEIHISFWAWESAIDAYQTLSVIAPVLTYGCPREGVNKLPCMKKGAHQQSFTGGPALKKRPWKEYRHGNFSCAMPGFKSVKSQKICRKKEWVFIYPPQVP